MPYKDLGGGSRRYSRMTAAEIAELSRASPDASSCAMPARAILAGAKVITVRPAEPAASPEPPPEDPSGRRGRAPTSPSFS